MFGLAVGAGMVTQSVVALSVYMGTKTRGTKNAICLVCGLPILLFHGGRGLSVGRAWVGLSSRWRGTGLGLQGGVALGISRFSVGAMAAASRG
jgi:hypothetical protein